MQVICLGDIAICEENLPEWEHPAGTSSGDCRVIFNWEVPSASLLNPTPRPSGGPRLLAQPNALSVLKKWLPGIATMATNHIVDGGVDGLDKNLQQLQQAGFSTVGAGRTSEEINRPLLWETSEGCLAIINWVFPETNPEWQAVPGPNCWPGIDEATRQIKELKEQADWVMVIVHWGDELFAYPTIQDRETARALADAGADLIVGHHPHVVRGVETIGKCPVYYSLGNFYFSDVPGKNGDWIMRRTPRTSEALVLQVTFSKGMPPECHLRSFRQSNKQTLPDPLHRAERRSKEASRPLQKYHTDTYVRWYKNQRRLFDLLGYRLHFRLWQLGLTGMARYILQRRKNA